MVSVTELNDPDAWCTIVQESRHSSSQQISLQLADHGIRPYTSTDRCVTNYRNHFSIQIHCGHYSKQEWSELSRDPDIQVSGSSTRRESITFDITTAIVHIQVKTNILTLLYIVHIRLWHLCNTSMYSTAWLHVLCKYWPFFFGKDKTAHAEFSNV